MKRFAIALVLCTAATGLAQDRDRGPRGPRGFGDGGWDRGAMIDRFARRIADELQLTTDQRYAFDEIVAARSAAAAEETGGDPGAMWQEIRDAREAGDEARIQELRGQMESRMQDMQARMDSFFTEIDPILTDDQRLQLSEVRARMDERAQGFRDMQRGRELVRRMRGELDLTEEQTVLFDELTGEMREQFMSRERREEMRGVIDELRTEAEAEAPDPARIEELRAQLRDMRPDGQAIFDNFMLQVEEMLDADQRAALATLKDEVGMPGVDAAPGAREEPGVVDLRTLARLVRQVDLSPEQRSEVREILDAANDQAQEIGRRDRAAQDKHAGDTLARVRELLDGEQLAELDRLVERYARQPRSSGGRERRTRGEDAP